MTNSKCKGPHINHELLKNLLVQDSTNEMLTKNRSSEIIPIFIGKTFTIYNGNSYINIPITEDMVGHKFGEFAFTRKKYFFKKKTNKK